MLFELFISFVLIFLLLCTMELLWRTGKIQVENSRKVVHIGAGIIIAFWPYYIDWIYIQLASLLLLLVVVISYKLQLFKSIHAVKRLSIGELLYPVGIGLCALLEPAPWAFTIAILHLTLADGLAGMVGTRYGKSTTYSILGHKKSLAGSATFFVVSLLILSVASLVVVDNQMPHNLAWLLVTALILTGLENASWYGLDDITVPLATVALLNLLPM